MVQSERGLNRVDVPSPGRERDMAAKAFLNKHPDLRIRMAVIPPKDLYSALATHISLHEVPERRSDLISGLREELIAQLSMQPHLAADDRPIETAHITTSHSKMVGNEPTHQDGPPATKAFISSLDQIKDPAHSVAAELTHPREPVAFAGHRPGALDEHEGIYRQRGRQAYEDLMGGITSLSIETVGAIASVEHLAANPHATDGDFKASLARVETLQRTLGKAIHGLQAAIANKLMEQFEREGINLEPAKLSKIAEAAIMDSRVPRSVAFCANECRLFDQRFQEILKERQNTMLKSGKKPNPNDTIEPGTSYEPRP